MYAKNRQGKAPIAGVLGYHSFVIMQHTLLKFGLQVISTHCDEISKLGLGGGGCSR